MGMRKCCEKIVGLSLHRLASAYVMVLIKRLVGSLELQPRSCQKLKNNCVEGNCIATV